MNTSGEAAEQVMRMSLEGAEILIKLTGSGAKNAAVLLYSIYKEQNKTRGKERLTNMLRSGKPLKVYTFKRDNLEKFKEVAKEYGNGSPQRGKSNAVGTEDEQHPQCCYGNHCKRFDLLLKVQLPCIEKRSNRFARE